MRPTKTQRSRMSGSASVASPTTEDASRSGTTQAKQTTLPYPVAQACSSFTTKTGKTIISGSTNKDDSEYRQPIPEAIASRAQSSAVRHEAPDRAAGETASLPSASLVQCIG